LVSFRRLSISRRWFLTISSGLGAGALLTAGPVTQPSLFEEIPPAASGISWVHDNAMSEERYLPETFGPGCAFLDYDNDGWMDIYLVNSGPCEFFKPRRPLRNALYHNNRDGTFTDVTAKAGVAGGVFGMGVAVGDYNNDGWPDLFVTAYGGPILYRNNRDGTFTDVTQKAGLAAAGWSTSAVWFDYDNDGLLDLFVCQFVEYGRDTYFACGNNVLGRRYYCIPSVFPSVASRLYHNNGDGTFTDVTHGTAIEAARGKGLGVVATDINNDGLMDLFVANDTVQDFLFVNRGNNHWDEIAISAEVGFSENGKARSGMGVDAADFNGDGWEDLFVSNVDQEMYSLYQNQGDETFRDVAHRHGIAQSTRLLSGWGLKFFDYDNDGNLDLILANGHPEDMIEKYSPQVTYKERLLLFHQENGILRDVSATAGPPFARRFSARGLAIGDYNNDGYPDVLIGANGGPPALLRNRASSGNGWLGVKLRGVRCNRDAVGARVTWSAAGVKRSRLKTSGGSYLSSHDPRMILGIGRATALDWVEVRWPGPSARVEQFTGLATGRYVELVEGRGTA